jgi:hypothetical protein
MRGTLLLLASLAITACSARDEPPRDSVGREIADDYRGAMDDAAKVDQQVQQAKDDVDAALKRAEGNADD